MKTKETGHFEFEGVRVSIIKSDKEYVFFGVSVFHPLAYQDLETKGFSRGLSLEGTEEGDKGLIKDFYWYGTKIMETKEEKMSYLVKRFKQFKNLMIEAEENEKN